MKGQPALDIDLAPLPRDAVVYDIVYVPLETAVAAAARARGNRCVDGLGMLLHQGRPGFAAWFGKEVNVSTEQRRAVAADLGVERRRSRKEYRHGKQSAQRLQATVPHQPVPRSQRAVLLS